MYEKNKVPEIGKGTVAIYERGDGTFLVVELTRFASNEQDQAEQYAALLAGQDIFEWHGGTLH